MISVVLFNTRRRRDRRSWFEAVDRFEKLKIKINRENDVLSSFTKICKVARNASFVLEKEKSNRSVRSIR